MEAIKEIVEVVKTTVEMAKENVQDNIKTSIAFTRNLPNILGGTFILMFMPEKMKQGKTK